MLGKRNDRQLEHLGAFAEQFEGSTQAADKAPDAESTGTESNIVDATTTLPEEDISETE